jgi:hypothetical protein
MRILLNSPLWDKVPLLRQTSQYSGVASNARYLINPNDAYDIDYVLVTHPGLFRCSLDNRPKSVYIHMEHPAVWMPNPSELENIDVLISPFRLFDTSSTNTLFIHGLPCVPWFYGIDFSTSHGLLHKPLKANHELDGLTNICLPNKTKLLSIICSSKSFLPGHYWRKELISAVKSYFGRNVDVFGFGHNPVKDKKDAIDPYVFSLVLENTDESLYITEKIVDCLLGWTTPIYAGSPEASGILNTSIPRIPIGTPIDSALSIIKNVLGSGGLDTRSLHTAREAALKRLNIFEELPRILSILS